MLLSAVDDLLNVLLESKDANLLGAYIGSVMPDNSEWEKMRQSLPVQVCLILESAHIILKFVFHAGLNILIVFWERKNVNEMCILLSLSAFECSYIGYLIFTRQQLIRQLTVNRT